MTEEISSQRPLFMRNPDVVLHEEDPDGALVFNPDTDQIKVLNQTGFFIWRLCDGSHDMERIIARVRETFDGVPEDQVLIQVQDFVNDMVGSGFIGTMEEERA